MPRDDEIADDFISGALKRSASYHADYGGKTYGELKVLAGARPPDVRARRMRKLIEQADRLRRKSRGRRP